MSHSSEVSLRHKLDTHQLDQCRTALIESTEEVCYVHPTGWISLPEETVEPLITLGVQAALERAREAVVIGGTYYHYRNPGDSYIVLCLGFTSAGDVYVMYEALYGEKLVWARPVSSWLDTIGIHKRFTLRQ